MTTAEFRVVAASGLDLGLEPAIEAADRRAGPNDRRALSLRWLAAVVLAGVAGAALIGVTIYAAVDGQSNLASAPERAVAHGRGADEADGLSRGDRLVKSADVVAEKQKFRAPTTVKVGDRQVIRVHGFTRVTTTLALAPTAAADDVPEFNPLKLLGGDAGAPDLPPDPGPALSDADASFTVGDLLSSDPNLIGGALSEDEVQAQVSEFGRTSASPARAPLPAQALLMRTSRAGALPPNGLGFADVGAPAAAFSSIEVRMVPENVTEVARTDPPRDDRDVAEKLVVFRHGDVLEDVLHANGASRDQAHAIAGAFAPRHGEAPVAEGRRLKLFFAKLGDGLPAQIARLSVYSDENLETTIALDDAGSYVRVDKPDGTAQAQRPRSEDDAGGMRLYDSFYQTALKQDVPRPVIDSLVRIFANDVDFQRSVAGGDSFDALYGDGEDADAHPELLYASITVRDEIFKYYRFQAPDDASVDFYDENGRSVRKFLIRNPVPSAQLTSGFGIRFHPILGYSRPHTGVDWAAAVGTPILAAGSGTVLRADRESAYGNHVEIQHANGYITTYSHMAGFARGIADGARVRQGQVVGYLGQTGLATGPHLHYEVIVNGHFVDPMRVKLARTREIAGKAMDDFKRERDRIEALMASAPNAVAAGADKHAAN